MTRVSYFFKERFVVMFVILRLKLKEDRGERKKIEVLVGKPLFLLEFLLTLYEYVFCDPFIYYLMGMPFL